MTVDWESPPVVVSTIGVGVHPVATKAPTAQSSHAARVVKRAVDFVDFDRIVSSEPIWNPHRAVDRTEALAETSAHLHSFLFRGLSEVQAPAVNVRSLFSLCS